MADTKTDKEPSIEEILESIRQIISEDDPAAKPAEAPQPAAAAPEPVPVAPPPRPTPTPPAPARIQQEEPVLELTDRVIPQKPDPAPQPVADTGAHLLSDMATNASAAAMAKLLAGNVAVETDVPGRIGQVTLEDMANELMRPLIKSWLDQNLPRIIEKMVQKEIERVSRKAMSQ